MSESNLQHALQQGLVHHHAGRLQEAEAIYRQVLAIAPDNADACHLLGIVAHQVRQYEAALRLIGRAIELSPFMGMYYNSLGEVYRAMGQYEPAMAAFRMCLARHPQSVEALNNVGLTYDGLGDLVEAEKYYRQALAISPEFPDAWNNLGTVLARVARYEEAIAAHRRALDISPQYAAAHNNLGVAYEKAGRLEEAIEAYRQATVANPQLAESFHNMGVPLVKFNRIDEAMAAWERAIALRAEYPDPHFNLALALLLTGNLERGWAEHEWRWQVPTLPRPRGFREPQWDGADIAGKTILVHCEQGYGDSIQFCRLMPLLARHGARIVFECQRELVDLLRCVPQVWKLVATGDPLPAFDVQIPLLSLPLPLKIRWENLPAEVPYLVVPWERIEPWRKRVEEALASAPLAASVSPLPSPLSLRAPLRVGLVWAGRPTHHDDANRSMALSDLAALATVPNVQFFSLQKGEAARQAADPPRGLRLIDLTEHLHDFADTAALVQQLDLVITVDTVVAHLAGSLAKPVWTALPFAPDWRWLMDRSDSPWYPTMRLYRQKTRKDWSSVANDLATDLAKARIATNEHKCTQM